jgi:chromate transporter
MAETAAAPQSALALFLAFQRLALQGFGGVLPVALRELVERRGWLTKEQFLELLSIGQVLPGPNIVNMALIFGDRCFGWRGALAASAGLLAAPLALVLVLAVAVRQGADLPFIAGALRGMGIVAAGLILSTAIKLAGGLRRSALGAAACIGLVAATVALVVGLRLPLVWVLLVVAPTALAIAWGRVGR